MRNTLTCFAWACLLLACGGRTKATDDGHYAAESLIIEPIADHVYQHISFLDTETFGKVSCNGMIVYDNQEAIIFDTPADNESSLELIRWVESNLHCTIKAIIPTHFHGDCLGGLEVFRERNIPAYASRLTIDLAKAGNSVVPENAFDSLLELTVGDRKVISVFMGAGHTRDNIVGFFPDEEIMFGGCLIKSKGAGKGNLEDADVNVWPSTVAAIRAQFPDVRIVIPGHGDPGGQDLLEYTQTLFEKP